MAVVCTLILAHNGTVTLPICEKLLENEHKAKRNGRLKKKLEFFPFPSFFPYWYSSVPPAILHICAKKKKKKKKKVKSFWFQSSPQFSTAQADVSWVTPTPHHGSNI